MAQACAAHMMRALPTCMRSLAKGVVVVKAKGCGVNTALQRAASLHQAWRQAGRKNSMTLVWSDGGHSARHGRTSLRHVVAVISMRGEWVVFEPTSEESGQLAMPQLAHGMLSVGGHRMPHSRWFSRNSATSKCGKAGKACRSCIRSHPVTPLIVRGRQPMAAGTCVAHCVLFAVSLARRMCHDARTRPQPLPAAALASVPTDVEAADLQSRLFGQ